MTVRPDGGGGGAVVLIDPDSLRQAAGKLKGVSGELSSLVTALGGDAFPTMPPGVAAAVQGAIAEAAGGICTQPATLDDTCVELTRRAFWAQYADSMMGGYALSGPARQEFLSYLRDGTLLRYATPKEAVAAGMELALVSRNFRHDQGQLFQLAAALQGVERSGIPTAELRAFSAGFVNRFGAENMELVPRVIQAMEWSRAIAFGQSTDPNLLRDVARQWSDQKLQTNPVEDLLAPFSICLANATVSGQLTRTVEEGIAGGEDTWSTAMLLSQGGRFETGFLLECFRTGVVEKVVDDSRYYGPQNLGGEPPPGDEYALGQMWSGGKEHVPFDTKQIVLDALARNPAAAAQALTRPFPAVQVFDGMGNRVEVSDPMQLLYRYGHFDDHGAAFGRAYAAATDFYAQSPSDVAAIHQGSQLTANALHLFLDDPGVPVPNQSGFADGLARDLVRHHIGQLYDSALLNIDVGGSEGIQVQGLEHVANAQIAPGELRLSRDALIDTVNRLSGNSAAFSTFVHGSAAFQAALIDANTQHLPDPSDAAPGWATKIGSFDGALLNGADIHRVGDFDAASARHQLVADFFKEAANGVVALGDPVADAAVHTGIGVAIDNVFPGPDAHSVEWKNFDARQSMQNSLQASITAGYYKHGLIAAPPPGDVLGNGSLVSFDRLPAGGDAQAQFAAWMKSDSVTKVTAPAFETAQNTISARVGDFSP